MNKANPQLIEIARSLGIRVDHKKTKSQIIGAMRRNGIRIKH